LITPLFSIKYFKKKEERFRMRENKKHIDDLIHNFITEDKIKNIANILDALVEILILLEPLLEKMKSMGNANDLSNLSTLLQDLMN